MLRRRFNSDVRLLFASQAVSSVGDYALTIALSIAVFRITHSALNVALVYVVTVLPAMLGLLTGPLLDRFALKRILIASDLVRAGLTAVVPIVLHTSLVLMYAAVFLVTLLGVVFQSARLALIPEAAGDNDLNRINSFDSTTLIFGSLAGLAVGGWLAGLAYRSVFWIDSATFLASALLLWRMKAGVRRNPATQRRSSFRRDLIAGYRYIAREPVLAYNVYGNTLLNLGVGMFNPMLVILCYRQLGSNNLGYTLLEVLQLAGLAIAGIYMAFVMQSFRKSALLLGGNLTTGLLIMALAVPNDLLLAGILVFLIGIGNVVGNAVSRTMLMERSSSEHRAKVMAVRMALGRPVNTLGAFGAGLLVQGAHAPAAVVMLLAGMLISSFALLALAVPSVLHYRTPVAEVVGAQAAASET